MPIIAPLREKLYTHYIRSLGGATSIQRRIDDTFANRVVEMTSNDRRSRAQYESDRNGALLLAARVLRWSDRNEALPLRSSESSPAAEYLRDSATRFYFVPFRGYCRVMHLN